MTGSDVAEADPVQRPPARLSDPAPKAQHRWRAFLRHLAEMVLAMFAGMLLLDLIWTAFLPAIGAASLLDVPEIRALIMATAMTLGMSVWMAYRRHSPAAIAEMGAAMYVSFLIAFLPYWLGLLSAVGAMEIGHVLMVPAMAGAMLLRRGEYMRGHHDLAHPEPSRAMRGVRGHRPRVRPEHPLLLPRGDLVGPGRTGDFADSPDAGCHLA